ncbi:MAG: glycosyltransferase, partial [Crocinitomicaceae bacterium]
MSVIESKLKKSILIIGTVWPEPSSSAAGARMLQIIKTFQKEFDVVEITFASAAIINNHSFDLNSIGVKTQSIELNNSSFDRFVKELQPIIVVFDRFMTEEQYGWRVSEN